MQTQPICRVVVENFVGDREYIWTCSDTSYIAALESVATEIKARIGSRFYTVEVFRKDPATESQGRWEITSFQL